MVYCYGKSEGERMKLMKVDGIVWVIQTKATLKTVLNQIIAYYYMDSSDCKPVQKALRSENGPHNDTRVKLLLQPPDILPNSTKRFLMSTEHTVFFAPAIIFHTFRQMVDRSYFQF